MIYNIFVSTNLRSVSEIFVHKARVGVILDILSLNKVFQVIEGLATSVLELQNIHLENVHLCSQMQRKLSLPPAYQYTR